MNRKNCVNRRGFLKGAAQLTAGAAVFPSLIPSSVLGQNAPSNKIVMGAIGVGSMGRGDLKGFLGKSEIHVTCVCDVDTKHIDQAKKMVDDKYGNKDCKGYGDYKELLAEQKLDAVTHALPDHWHGIISIDCARAGLDIHGQKPLARTISEGRAICNAVKRYGRIWQTGSWQRSVRNFHRAAELVRNGRIGKVKYVEVGLPDGRPTSPNFSKSTPPANLNWDRWLGPAPWREYQIFSERRNSVHWDWRWIMDYSGGQLTDWAGHHIDIAHWGMGFDETGPIEIAGAGEYPTEGLYDTPYAYKFTCKYRNGVEIVVANRSQLPHAQGACWYGENNQWIHVSRRGLQASDAKILKEVIGPNETRLYKCTDHKQNFIDCVKNRKATITPAETAHRSISVGLLGEIAMLTGRKLSWNPDTEHFVNDAGAESMLSRPFRSPLHL